MKKHLSILTVSVVLASAAQSAVLASWTIDPTPPADSNNSTTSPTISATTGTGTLSGLHADAATDWSTPVGNGSTDSFSSNTWSVGDYYQFATSSTGSEDITVSFDQVSSSTGPGSFQFSYSTDGSSFTNFGSAYTVLVNTGANTWASGAPIATTTYTFDLSSVPAIENQATIYFRLTQASTVSAGGATVATGGTSRIDNIVVSAVPVPEPTAALLGAVGLLGLLRRRR